MFLRIVSVLSLVLGGCFYYDSTWTQETESQERQAAARTPETTRSSGDERRWRAVRRVPVRAWATDRYRAEVHSWRGHVEELLEHANEVLGPTLRIRLVLADARPWSGVEGDSLEPILEHLEAQDPGDDVELVMGLLGSTTRLSARFDTLGMARVHGHHMVLRAANDAAEADAIEEGFDHLSREERARLRRRRRLHKELAVLLHEVGHLHGAIHVRERWALMNPIYREEMARYAPQTVALMRPVAAERGRSEGERDPRGLLEALAEVLRSQEDGWVPEERQALLADLERILAAGGAAASPAPAQENDGAGTLWDVTGLADADRDAFRRAREAAQRGRVRDSWELLSPLVEAYGDTYAVQEVACALYHAGATPREAGRACERMMDLATAFGRGAPTESRARR